MAENEKKEDQQQKSVDDVKPEGTEKKSDEVKELQSPPNVAPIGPGVAELPGTSEPPGASLPVGPLTSDELKKNAEEEDRKTMRVVQIVQHVGNQRIEIHPVQNIKVRSDITGMLSQALNNIQNEDVMRNTAALLKEAVAMIKKDDEKKQ